MAALLLSQEPAAWRTAVQAQREKALRAPPRGCRGDAAGRDCDTVHRADRRGRRRDQISSLRRMRSATERSGARARLRTTERSWTPGARPRESIIGFIYVGSVAVPGKPRSPRSDAPIAPWPE
jgi:hypothetical protein